MTLTKMTLVDSVYGQFQIPKKDCLKIVDRLFAIMKEELARGNEVKISGFGKWSVRSKKERRGRNPQTGREIRIDARRVVTFKPSLVLKGKLN